MGLIMAGLGGMAEAGLNILQDERKNDAQTERDTRLATIQEELVAKRAQTVADMQEKVRAAKENRQADQYDQIDARAVENGLQRDATSMTRGAAGLPSEGDFAGQAVKPEDIASLPPAARLAYERAGLINRPSGSRLTLDKVDSARSIGADAEVRKELRDQYGAEVKSEKDASSAALAQSRLDEVTRNNDLRNDVALKNADSSAKRSEALMARALGGSGSNKSEKVMTYMEGRRKEIAAESTEINKLMAADLKNAEFGTAEEKAAIKISYQEKLDGVTKDRRQMDADFAHLRDKFELPALPAEKPVADKPASGVTGGVKSPASKAAFDALPSGSLFVNPADGKTYKKK